MSYMSAIIRFNLLSDLFFYLFVELVAYSKKSAISSREIQTSILLGELVEHAISEAWGIKSLPLLTRNSRWCAVLQDVFDKLACLSEVCSSAVMLPICIILP